VQTGRHRGSSRPGGPALQARLDQPHGQRVRTHVLGHALPEQPVGGAVTTGPLCPPTVRDMSIHCAKGRLGPTALQVLVVPACAASRSHAARSRTSTTWVGASGVSGTSIGPRGHARRGRPSSRSFRCGHLVRRSGLVWPPAAGRRDTCSQATLASPYRSRSTSSLCRAPRPPGSRPRGRRPRRVVVPRRYLGRHLRASASWAPTMAGPRSVT
jgi:hypothetical protein